MTSLAHDLAIEVLALPAVDRARILELRIASFEPQSPAQKAWLDVANQRREGVRCGAVTMVPGAEALARTKARIA